MPGADARTPARLRLLDAAAGVAWWKGDLPGADRFYEQQVDLARSLDDPGALALALFNRSHTLRGGQGSPESAALRAEASRLFEQVGDARGAARVRWVAANLLISVDAAAAIREYEELTRLYLELDDVYYAAMAASSMSWSLHELGDLDRAVDYGYLSFRLASRNDDVSAAMVALREVEIHFHRLGYVREAAIIDGAFDALSSRYGMTTPPVFTENVMRRWSGSAALRDALGSELYDELRQAGSGMTIDDLSELIETTFATRQLERAESAPASSS